MRKGRKEGVVAMADCRQQFAGLGVEGKSEAAQKCFTSEAGFAVSESLTRKVLAEPKLYILSSQHSLAQKMLFPTKLPGVDL